MAFYKDRDNIIIGLRPVMEAIKKEVILDKVMVAKGMEHRQWEELRGYFFDYQIPYKVVPREKLDSLTPKNHQGVVAFISPIPFYDAELVISRLINEGKSPLVLLADGVTDMRNFGGIVRTAEGAGVDIILLPFRDNVAINDDAVKTSAGALLHVPIAKVFNLTKIITFIKEMGFQVVVCQENAKLDYNEIDYTGPTLLVVGAEDTGISSEVYQAATHEIKIPMQGTISSLNVSVATGIICFEAVKQRTKI